MNLTILWIPIAKCCFSHHFQYSIRIWKRSEHLKIQNGDVIYVAVVAMEIS